MKRNVSGLLSIGFSAVMVLFCLAVPAHSADQDIKAKRNLYECQKNAAEYTYNLDRAGDKNLFDSHVRDCMAIKRKMVGATLNLKGSSPAYCTDKDGAWCSSCWVNPVNKWCCTVRKQNLSASADCGFEDGQCQYTDCKSCKNTCLMPPKNYYGPTNIKIINQTDSDVTIAFVTGALTKPGELGACTNPDKIVSYQWVAENNGKWCKSPQAGEKPNSGWCTGIIPKGGSVEVNRTGTDAADKCLTGAIHLGGKASCPEKGKPDTKNGFTQGEFTLNPTDTATEAVDISLVNGANYAMSINLSGDSWTYKNNKDEVTVIRSIGPNEGLSGDNNKPGIYPPGCTDCVQLVDNLPCTDIPPNFSNDKCQKTRQCHVQRGGITGGKVEFVITKKF